MWFEESELFLESLTVESERWLLTKLKPYFTGVSQYDSKDLDGASIAQKEGSDAIRKQCKVCTC